MFLIDGSIDLFIHRKKKKKQDPWNDQLIIFTTATGQTHTHTSCPYLSIYGFTKCLSIVCIHAYIHMRYNIFRFLKQFMIADSAAPCTSVYCVLLYSLHLGDGGGVKVIDI